MIVQVGIFTWCSIVMICCWLMERPRRAFLTWMLDGSKQVAAAIYGKFYNILQTVYFTAYLVQPQEMEDPCVFYLMLIITDCFFTTFLCWGANSLMRPILLRNFGIDIGDYGDDQAKEQAPTPRTGGCEPPLNWQGKVKSYLEQLATWIAIVAVVRFIVSLILLACHQPFYELVEAMFMHMELKDPSLRLIFSVLIFPAVADAFQICVQDYFLKKGAEPEKGSADCKETAAPLAEAC